MDQSEIRRMIAASDRIAEALEAQAAQQRQAIQRLIQQLADKDRRNLQ